MYVCDPPPDSYLETLIREVMAFEDEVFGRWLGHEGGALIVGLSVSHVSLYNPMDCSPPDTSGHGILQARILEWVAILFSRGSFPPKDQTPISRIAGRFFTVWASREARIRQTQEEGSHPAQLNWLPDHRLPAPRPVRCRCLLFKPPCLWYLSEQPELAKSRQKEKVCEGQL